MGLPSSQLYLYGKYSYQAPVVGIYKIALLFQLHFLLRQSIDIRLISFVFYLFSASLWLYLLSLLLNSIESSSPIHARQGLHGALSEVEVAFVEYPFGNWIRPIKLIAIEFEEIMPQAHNGDQLRPSQADHREQPAASVSEAHHS
jgi:hypothetical protein